VRREGRTGHGTSHVQAGGPGCRGGKHVGTPGSFGTAVARSGRRSAGLNAGRIIHRGITRLAPTPRGGPQRQGVGQRAPTAPTRRGKTSAQNTRRRVSASHERAVHALRPSNEEPLRRAARAGAAGAEAGCEKTSAAHRDGGRSPAAPASRGHSARTAAPRNPGGQKRPALVGRTSNPAFEDIFFPSTRAGTSRGARGRGPSEHIAWS